MLARKHMPWADERFRGWGRDRVVFTAHLAALGRHFQVHPRAFLLHISHATGRAFFAMHDLWDELDRLYKEARAGVATGGYQPPARYACGRHTLGPLMEGGDHSASGVGSGGSHLRQFPGSTLMGRRQDRS